MAKRLFQTLMIAVITVMVISCGKSAAEGPVTGKYVDEFGNEFELREDHTATIQFDGQDKINETYWHDGANNDTSFVTIEYNGDTTYFYMSHGKLYRRLEDMKEGHPAINLERR